MCMDFQTSISTWGLALISAGYVLSLKKTCGPTARWIAILVLIFTLIQLLEAGIWYNYDNELNGKLTRLILLALLLQPVINFYMAYTTTGKLWYGFLAYVLIAIGVALYLYNSKDKFKSIKGENGHLIWLQNDKNLFSDKKLLGLIYLFGILYPMLYIPNFKAKIATIGITLGTALYSIYNYNSTGEFSSMWCFSAALMVPVYVLVAKVCK